VIYAGDRRELLPFHGPNGERLLWTKWSDILFYSISNRWKNEFNERDLFDLSDDGVTRLRRLALFDHRAVARSKDATSWTISRPVRPTSTNLRASGSPPCSSAR
jgi:hypothetical protein